MSAIDIRPANVRTERYDYEDTRSLRSVYAFDREIAENLTPEEAQELAGELHQACTFAQALEIAARLGVK
jgi:hypothetical protein